MRLTLSYALYRDSANRRAVLERQRTLLGVDESLLAMAVTREAPRAAESAPTPAAAPENAEAVRRALSFACALVDALRDPVFMESGGRVGFACLHLYERDSALPGDRLPPTTSCADVMLKGVPKVVVCVCGHGSSGADALVAVICARLGLSVEVERLLHLDDCGV